jgi:DNA-binding SARP family transcriptional activator
MQCREGIEFAVLGPLEVRRGQRPVPVRGWRQQTVLAMLLLADGHVVPVGRLVEAVWNGDPPDGAVKAVRNCVSTLRCRSGEAAGLAIPIETTAAGYRLPLEGCHLDAREFRQQAGAARRLAAAGQPVQAVAGLREALGLWRGSALAGTGSRIVQAEAARLDEQRMTALEDCLDLQLALGQHRQVVSELQALVRENPLRERIAGQLMLALYRSGRQAEALDAYRRLAERLAEELGIDPAGEVTRLHEAILRQEPSLALAGAEPPSPPPSPAPSPAQLPLNVPGFTGRAAELTRLHALLPEGGATVLISAIGGTAGVGKTALAVRFAHQVADRYPDGQLYVNLRGFHPSGSPVEPAAALRGFLRALGVAADAISVDADSQAALYRSLLAGKRMLVLLDNARDAAQVRPLLPGSPGCLVIVTSRSELTGLVAAEGARPVTLDVLTTDEARDLLAGRLGRDRLDREPGAADDLARLCAGLPLALVIVAARAAARPELALADLAAELRDTQSRLDVLGTGDPATDLRAVFSWSCRQLSERAARMFRLLGLHPGPDITAPAAAGLAAAGVREARTLLAELTRGRLVIEHAPGRYTLHDLLRAYAADLATAPETADDPRAALGRLFDHYLATAAAAMDLLHPAEAHRRPRIALAAVPTPDLDSPQAALAWLDAERACLVAVTAHAAAHGWPSHAVRLSATIERHLRGGHYPDGLSVHGHARDAARQAGDHDGEAGALLALGVLHWMLGARDKAADHIGQALARYRRTGNELGRARCLSNLGALEADQGRYEPAARYLEESLVLTRAAGDRPGEATVLINLADILRRVGGGRQATEHLQRALALCRQDGDRYGEAHALQTLGEVEQRAGRLEPAAGHYRQALAVFRQIGHQKGEAWVLTYLGAICNHLGQPERAAEHHRESMMVSRRVGDRDGEAVALNGLGEAACATGRATEALTHHMAALALARGTGNPEQQARAHAGLGHAHDALGRAASAREHFQHAFDLYARLGYPDAEKIRPRLAGRGDRDPAPAATV